MRRFTETSNEVGGAYTYDLVEWNKLKVEEERQAAETHPYRDEFRKFYKKLHPMTKKKRT
jgi:hypothetical protein